MIGVIYQSLMFFVHVGDDVQKVVLVDVSEFKFY